MSRLHRWAFGSQAAPSAKLVLLALIEHADADRQCNPSVPYLAEWTGLSVRTVRVCLGELAECELLTRIDREGTSNVYILTPAESAAPPARSATPPAKSAGVTKRGPAGFAGVNDEKEGPTPAESAAKQRLLTSSFSSSAVVPESKLIASKPPNPLLRLVGGTAHNVSFDAFWAAYPRKEAKPRARLAWTKAITRSTIAEIMAGLDRFQFNPEPSKQPHPASWLNGDRWTDQQAPNLYAPELRPEPELPAARRIRQTFATRRRLAGLEDNEPFIEHNPEATMVLR